MKKLNLFLFALAGMFLLAACTEAENKDNSAENPVPIIRYRGIGIDLENGVSTEANIRRLGSWGVNHVRWTFENWIDQTNQTVDEYLSWIDERCDGLEAMLPYLEEEGITVCLNIHHPPRGRDANNVMRMFLKNGEDLQGAFIEGWRRIATRFKDSKIVVLYDILNEPDDSGTGYGLIDWRNLFTKTVEEILAIDDTKKFIFEPKWDNYRGLEPLPPDNIVYSVHVYQPHEVTHTGWVGAYPVKAVYPGEINGVYWDKAKLRERLLNAMNFVKTHKVEMYVGEFGCARWAPNHSAYNYFRACLEIFEEEGWHYAFFKDYPNASTNYAANTWSLQYDEVYNSGTPVDYETDRLQLLKTYWAKNRE